MFLPPHLLSAPGAENDWFIISYTGRMQKSILLFLFLQKFEFHPQLVASYLKVNCESQL